MKNEKKSNKKENCGNNSTKEDNCVPVSLIDRVTAAGAAFYADKNKKRNK